MMTTTRRLLTAAVLASVAACADRSLTNPGTPEYAKGGGGSPTVTSTSPEGSVVNVTLDVRVYGSNFDRNSRAELALNGVVGPKVRTNSTSFVSSSQLIANVTIAADADTGAYDVVVTTSTGKKGIGTEMFAVQYVLDLDAGRTEVVYHVARHISDAGWVFTQPDLVWLDATVPLGETQLPTPSNSDFGNGRGDIIGHNGSNTAYWVLLADGAGGWNQSGSLVPPAGWPTSRAPVVNGVNDRRIVVGAAVDPARGNDSPVMWLPSAADSASYTVFPLALPAKLPGCALTSVIPRAINDRADTIEVVGTARQVAEGQGTCLRRAIIWKVTLSPGGPSSSAADLPRPTAIPGSRENPASVEYEANDINDAGVVAGRLYNAKVQRPVRWWPCGVGSSGCTGPGWRVESISHSGLSEAVDACGRATIFGGGGPMIWEVDGAGTPLGLPPELEGVATGMMGPLDINANLAVGAANLGNSNFHGLVWHLPACTPLVQP